VIDRLRAIQHAGGADADPALVAGLETERRELAELRRRGARWPSELRDRFGALQSRLLTEMNRRLADLRREVQHEQAGSNAPRGDRLVRALEGAAGALWSEMTSAMLDGVAEIAAEVEGQLGLVVADELPDAVLGIPERIAARERTIPRVLVAGDLFSDVTRLLYSGLPGIGLSAVFHMSALITVPAAILLGAVTVFAGRWRAVRTAQQHQATQLLSEFVDDLRTELPPVLQRQIQLCQRLLEERVNAHLQARQRELSMVLEERRRALASEESSRQRERLRTDALAVLARRIRSELTSMHGDIAGGGSRSELGPTRSSAPGLPERRVPSPAEGESE
jgi:hypothetical protein